jgi:uncharacterized membrane protein
MLASISRVSWQRLAILVNIRSYARRIATGFATVPVALYGAVLFMSGVAFFILAHLLIDLHGPASALAKAFGRDLKGWISPILYVLGIGSAFVRPWIACCLYVTVAVIWFIPDRRIERAIVKE